MAKDLHNKSAAAGTVRSNALALGFFLLTALCHAEPAPLTIDDFARKPALSQISLSPDGRFLSGIIYIGEAQTLAIDELGVEETPYLITGRNWDIRWYEWMSPTDLLISVSLPMNMQGTPVVVSRLVHADVDQRKMRMLFEKEDALAFFQIQDRVVSFLPHEPDRFLLSGTDSDPARPRVYKAKLNSVRLPGRLVQKGVSGVRSWDADAQGNVRVGWGFTKDQRDGVLLLKTAAGEWRDYSELMGEGFEVVALPTFDLDLVLANKPTEDGFRPLWLFNAATGAWVEEIANHSDSEASSVWLSDDGAEIRAVNFQNENVPPLIFDEFFNTLKSAIDKLYPDTRNSISDISDDETRGIMRSVSGEIPNHYYLYDREEKSVKYLVSSYPTLHDRAPGVVHKVSFAARDGLEIPGYVTLPMGVALDDAPKLPFVVHPHGGPHARDFERFDWLVQLMVARGYGVLQLNFRGSTGYGLAFLRKGEQQWGQAMQDDITDGTHWLVEQGLADREKICIVGGSYGGYAAAMGLAKEPDLYTCGVAFNGVFDIEALLKNEDRFIGGRYATRFIGNLYKDRAELRQNSPINLVPQIKAPLLIVHGEEDRVVRVRQSRRMVDAMPRATYVELPKGDHYLSKPSNRRTFAHELTNFLAAHLGVGDHNVLTTQ